MIMDWEAYVLLYSETMVRVRSRNQFKKSEAIYALQLITQRLETNTFIRIRNIRYVNKWYLL